MSSGSIGGWFPSRDSSKVNFPPPMRIVLYSHIFQW